MLAVVVYHFARRCCPAAPRRRPVLRPLGLLITSLLLGEHQDGADRPPGLLGPPAPAAAPGRPAGHRGHRRPTAGAGTAAARLLPGGPLGHPRLRQQLAPDRRPTSPTSPPSGVAPDHAHWRLAIEEQFYLVWPLLVVAGVALLAHLAHGRRRLVVAAVGLGAAILRLRPPSWRGTSPRPPGPEPGLLRHRQPGLRAADRGPARRDHPPRSGATATGPHRRRGGGRPRLRGRPCSVGTDGTSAFLLPGRRAGCGRVAAAVLLVGLAADQPTVAAFGTHPLPRARADLLRRVPVPLADRAVVRPAP